MKCRCYAQTVKGKQCGNRAEFWRDYGKAGRRIPVCPYHANQETVQPYFDVRLKSLRQLRLFM
jgi:hypothetical protein